MITVLCGKVAAGKSAFAAREKNTLVLSCDDLMLGLFDGCLGAKHDETALRCLRYLFSVAIEAEKLGQDSLVDYGFWLRAERDAARTALRNFPHRILLVETPDELRRKRLQLRNERLRKAEGRVYLIEGALLDRMDAKWQPLGAEESDIQIYDNSEELA